MIILATHDDWWTRQCEAALLAEGVALRWVSAASPPALELEVSDDEAERASVILSELLGEELRRRPREAPARPQPLLLQPAFAFAAGMALLTLVFFWITGGTAARGPWQMHGAFVAPHVLSGEWYRLLTAATLHADVAHAVSNAGFFLLLAWAAADRLGVGVAALVWLATAVAGFVATILFSDTVVSVGASGGLFGLLGAAGGHAMRHWRSSELQRRGRLRAFGGAVLLLAFTAFSPQANVVAHVGGFVVGVLVGVLAPRAAARRPIQAAAALSCAVLLGGAWRLAL